MTEVQTKLSDSNSLDKGEVIAAASNDAGSAPAPDSFDAQLTLASVLRRRKSSSPGEIFKTERKSLASAMGEIAKNLDEGSVLVGRRLFAPVVDVSSPQ